MVLRLKSGENDRNFRLQYISTAIVTLEPGSALSSRYCRGSDRLQLPSINLCLIATRVAAVRVETPSFV